MQQEIIVESKKWNDVKAKALEYHKLSEKEKIGRSKIIATIRHQYTNYDCFPRSNRIKKTVNMCILKTYPYLLNHNWLTSKNIVH